MKIPRYIKKALGKSPVSIVFILLAVKLNGATSPFFKIGFRNGHFIQSIMLTGQKKCGDVTQKAQYNSCSVQQPTTGDCKLRQKCRCDCSVRSGGVENLECRTAFACEIRLSKPQYQYLQGKGCIEN